MRHMAAIPLLALALGAVLAVAWEAEIERVAPPPAADTPASLEVRDWMPQGAPAYEAVRADERAAMLLFAADW